MVLHPQDGSGVRGDQIVVATGAVEDTVPDIGAAKRVGAEIVTRPRIAEPDLQRGADLGGRGGDQRQVDDHGDDRLDPEPGGKAPTVMNGAVMRNFADADHPFASALVGGADLFVAEVDESDGSIARYDPTVAVVSNISLDHKSMEELRDLFGGFTGRARTAVLNLDNVETAALAQTMVDDGRAEAVLTFALGNEAADYAAHDLKPLPAGMTFDLTERSSGTRIAATLNVPGAHNVANALAALGAVRALGVPLEAAVKSLETFAGIKRRMEVVGVQQRDHRAR